MAHFGNPSVVAVENFDPIADSNALRKAMKGFGTDENALIEVLTKRSNAQRLEIQKVYKTHFGRDLIEDIQSETSGHFENLLVALLIPSLDFYVNQVNSAIAGLGTDEEILIEFLCGLSNAEVEILKQVYQAKFKNTLEDDIKSDTSGSFKRFLVSLCAAGRDEGVPLNPEEARTDAIELLKAGELKIGTDESTFNMILCRRSFDQLRLINEEYTKIAGHPLEEAIDKEFSGPIAQALQSIISYAHNKHEYFASRLHKSMAGFGTNDDQLIRIIVTRSEIDLLDIKAAFEVKYGKSLKSWIKGDTSGHYKHCLYALIKEERSS